LDKEVKYVKNSKAGKRRKKGQTGGHMGGSYYPYKGAALYLSSAYLKWERK